MRKTIQYIRALQIDKHWGANVSTRGMWGGDKVTLTSLQIYKDPSTPGTTGGEVWFGGGTGRVGQHDRVGRLTSNMRGTGQRSNLRVTRANQRADGARG